MSWRNRLPARPALLVLDFDGVLTDNFVHVDEHGVETVRCSKEDSMGLSLLRERGFPAVILSTETNPVVAARARKLKLPCYSGIADKGRALREIVAQHDLALERVIYLGNDVNDNDCLRMAGCGLVVEDAHPRASAVADAIVPKPGGRGAVREVCEAILDILDRAAKEPSKEAA